MPNVLLKKQVRQLLTIASTNLLLVLLATQTLAVEAANSFKHLQQEFDKTTSSLVKKYCLDCHSTEAREGELDLERFTSFADVRRDPQAWQWGLTTSGTIGASTALTLEACIPRVAEIAEAARSVRDDVIILCHGGPIAMPEDAQFVLNQLQIVDGFYGASSMERLPTETALTARVKEFTQITRR